MIHLLKAFIGPAHLKRLSIIVLVIAAIAGTVSGYFLSQGITNNPQALQQDEQPKTDVKNPQQDRRTFRDFAEGKVTKKPDSNKVGEYTEGTHLLVRDSLDPVALTSSVVDMSQYEGKKVKVYGETQKAIKEGWLMDVGRVEVVE